MRLNSLFVFFLWPILFTEAVFGQTVELRDAKKKYTVAEDLSILEDSEGKLDFSQIRAGEFNDRFVPGSSFSNNFGYSSSAYWFRIRVKNFNVEQGRYLLEIANPGLDSITYRSQDVQGLWRMKTVGDKLPFSSRDRRNRHFLFDLTVPVATYNHSTKAFDPSESEVYIRVKSTGNLHVPISIWQQDAFEEVNEEAQFIFGLIYGIILLMIVINLFSLVTSRMTSYLYYVLSMVFTLLLISILSGYGFQYLWPSSPLVQAKILPLALAMLGYWTVRFARSFLDANLNAPFLDSLARWALWVTLAIIPVLLFLSSQHAVYLSSGILVGNIMISIVMGLASFNKGLLVGMFFVVAFSVYLAGLAIYLMVALGSVPHNFFTGYSAYFAAAMQVTLLSLGMEAKVNELRREKDKMQLKTLQTEQDAKEKLEHRVIERTQELNDQALALANSYRNIQAMSAMGQEITSTRNFEHIFNILYYYVNKVMDVLVFSVNIFHQDKNMVEHKFKMRDNERLPTVSVSMDSEDSFSVWAIKNRQEIFLNNIAEEYKNYLADQSAEMGREVLSAIFIPLIVGEKVLGVMSVQSTKANAYSKQHLDIMKTLANYTAIALDNALAYGKLENSNTSILKSIQYAKRIQESILMNTNQIKQYFRDGFILYKPRDIVSGDFYWFAEKKERLILAAIDCTGHGVPGAFMTMMANDLLNHIVVENNITSPKKILNILDNKIRSTLNADNGHENRVQDGMDLSICTIYTKRKRLHFAGAKLPMFYFLNGQLVEIKGSKFPIGSDQFKKEKVFEEYIMPYEEGDKFYIFSDGFQDQFGGKNGSKYLVKRFRQLIQDIHHLEMSEQAQVLNEEHERWKGNESQTDDVLVIGIQL